MIVQAHTYTHTPSLSEDAVKLKIFCLSLFPSFTSNTEKLNMDDYTQIRIAWKSCVTILFFTLLMNEKNKIASICIARDIIHSLYQQNNSYKQPLY